MKTVLKIGNKEKIFPETKESEQLTGIMDLLFSIMDKSAESIGQDITGKKIELIFESNDRYLVIGRKGKEIENDGR